MAGEQTGGPAAPDEEIACARCGRLAPRAAMTAWRERERYRKFVAQDPRRGRTPFRYVYEYKEHLVCPDCHGRLRGGGRTADVAQRRAIGIIVAAVVLAIIVAALTPVVMPQLLSAFWRT